MRRRFLSALFLCMASPLWAEEEATVPYSFVEANILAIFYHELGHALIHSEELPIYGQEEDAADVASIVFIYWYFKQDPALEMARSVAQGFKAEAAMLKAEGEAPSFWDVHGSEEQRLYNTVCLFYGGDPKAHKQLAIEFDLPKERRETCEEEYWQAENSWGAVFDRLEARERKATMSFTGDGSSEGSLTEQLIAEEVKFINETLTLADPILVTYEDCGEPNAFYDPETYEIIMCSEFEDYLYELEANL